AHRRHHERGVIEMRGDHHRLHARLRPARARLEEVMPRDGEVAEAVAREHQPVLAGGDPSFDRRDHAVFAPRRGRQRGDLQQEPLAGLPRGRRGRCLGWNLGCDLGCSLGLGHGLGRGPLRDLVRCLLRGHGSTPDPP
ncbi:MAG: hypothetical protein ACK56I_02310, partial [bacterium]